MNKIASIFKYSLLFNNCQCRHAVQNTFRTVQVRFFQIEQRFVTPVAFSSNLPKDQVLNRPNGKIAITPVRSYAKGKDKKKEKGKAKVQINENQLSEVINVEGMKTQMQRAIDTLKNEYVKHVSLRSTTGSIESVVVHVDGKDHTLQELAQIVRKNPKLIVVNMGIFPQAIPAALKALAKSGLNLSPQQEGTTLYIPVPKVTKEHREGLLKNAKSLFVKCRDSVRDIQTKHTKAIKKQENLSKDLLISSEQQVVAIADTFIAQAETVFDSKQTELIGAKE